jgi:hypothetical protein
VLISILVLLAVLVFGGTFFVGMKVGEYKSRSHSYKHLRHQGFSDRNIRSMRPERYGSRRQRHGFGGEVLSIGTGTLTILRRDGTERIINFGSGTKVQAKERDSSIEDIAIGSEVIAIGKPDEDDAIQATVLILPSWQR